MSSTPGPWRWLWWSGDTHRLVDAGENHVGELKEADDEPYIITQRPEHPDMRLIQAAPMLVEALKNVKTVLADRDDLTDEACVVASQLIDNALREAGVEG